MLRRLVQGQSGKRNRDFGLHIISYLCTRGFPFIAIFLTAKVLGIDDFGRFIGVISFFLSMLLLVDVGFGLATTTRVAQSRTEDERDAGVILVIATSVCALLGLIVSGVMLLGTEWVQDLIFDGKDMRDYLVPGALFVPAAALGLVMQGGLQGMQQYKYLARIGVAAGSAYLVLVVGLAYWLGGPAAVWGAALGMVIRAAVGFYYARSLLRQGIQRLSASIFWNQLRAFVVVALPTSVAGFAAAPLNTFVIANMFRHDGGEEQVGAFGVAMQAFSVAMVIPGIFTQFALPRLSSMQDDGRLVRRRARLVGRYSAVALLVNACLCLPILIAPAFWLGLLGSKYAAFTSVLLIMVFAALVSVPEGVFSNYLISSGKNWRRVGIKYFRTFTILAVVWWTGAQTAHLTARAYLIGAFAIMLAHVLSLAYDLWRSSAKPGASIEPAV